MQRKKHKPGAIEQIRQQAEKRGVEIPAIANAYATIKDGNEIFLKVWAELETTRQYIGMEGYPGRLNILDIADYCDRFGYVGFYKDLIIDLILIVDLELLRDYGEKH